MLRAERAAGAPATSASVIDVTHIQCIGDWASGCAVSSATGTSDCTSYFHRVGGSWVVVSDQWDICPSELEVRGAPPPVAAALATSCPQGVGP